MALAPGSLPAMPSAGVHTGLYPGSQIDNTNGNQHPIFSDSVDFFNRHADMGLPDDILSVNDAQVCLEPANATFL